MYEICSSFKFLWKIACKSPKIFFTGIVISSQQINDANWKRPHLPSIRKGILADGLGLSFAGLFGSIGLSASPSFIGVSKITGALIICPMQITLETILLHPFVA